MIIKLSLIVPVFNADSFIFDKLCLLSKWEAEIDYKVEIILVNDGSKDLTSSIIEDYIKKNNSTFKHVSYNKNKGKGFAVKTGMLEAKGKYRIFTDADIPYGLEIIDSMLYYLEFKEYDVCIGNRNSRQSKYLVKMSVIRKLSSKIFTTIISRYVVTGVNDTQCGIKGFTENTAKTLFNKSLFNGFAFDVEILYLSFKFEYDIKRIPVSFEGNDISTINLAPTSIKMLWDIFRLPFLYHFFNKYR